MNLALLIALAACVALLLITIRLYERRVALLQEELDYAIVVLDAAPDCAHWGSTLDWDAQRGEWACPSHGSRFATDGRVVSGPATEPIAAHPARLEGDVAVVELAAET